MAKENKKPSIYSDRGTIGSSDELDEYGVWVKSEPEDLSVTEGGSLDSEETTSDFTGNLPDLDIPDIPDISDIPEEDDAGGELDDNAGEIDFTADFGEISDDLSSEEPLDDSKADDDESADLGFTEVSFDDLTAALGEDTTAEDLSDSEIPAELPEEKPNTVGKDAPDLSTQLLMKIADELASIRDELSTLKKEFAGLKPDDAREDHGFFDEDDDEKIALTGDEMDNILNTEDTGAVPEEAPAEEEAGEQDAQGGGFFNEDEDEPLALTGDELNNILNTADFTEEAGETESLGDDFTVETPPAELPAEDSIDEVQESIDLDINLDDTDFEDLGGEISLEQEEDLPDISFDSEAVESAVPEAPVPAPEDTSFLEEDPMASSQFEEALDLSGAVIDEPDLSGDIQDNPVEEPSLEDISIDLEEELIEPTEDLMIDPLAQESLDELSIDLPSLEEPLFDELPAEEIAVEETAVDEVPVEEITTDEAAVPAEPAVEETAVEETAVEEIDIPIDEEEEENPVSPDSADEADADIALIPEGFVVEADEEQTGDGDTDETDDEEPLDEPVVETAADADGIPSKLKEELKTVLSYMDQLLESLPDDKIEEFARSEYYDSYKKVFKELGLV